jgi:ribosomal protein S18 acetylase RimI-like enzyme
MLGIDLEFRGQNVAHRMLDVAERMVQDEWNCKSIGLHVRQGADGVARLYTTRGYVRDTSGDIDRRPLIFLEAYWKNFEQ